MKEFDIEKLERKNIYKVPDNLFENIQGKVMHDVKANKKTPIFKLNWGYAVAASVTLVFGAVFILNSNKNDSVKNSDSQKKYVNSQEAKRESEIAYETLKSDLISVENNNQIIENQVNNNPVYAQNNNSKKEKKTAEMVKPVKEDEPHMNEYLALFSNSEISELADDSTQDVYLDLYN